MKKPHIEHQDVEETTKTYTPFSAMFSYEDDIDHLKELEEKCKNGDMLKAIQERIKELSK